MTVARVRETEMRIESRELDQVLVVLTEPVALLATAANGQGLIFEETITAANLALWRIQLFNQLVMAQTLFNAVTLVEITAGSTTHPRRNELAGTAARQ